MVITFPITIGFIITFLTGDSEGYFFGTILSISDGVGDIGGIVWPLLFSLSINNCY